jgi:hypothetical protein
MQAVSRLDTRIRPAQEAALFRQGRVRAFCGCSFHASPLAGIVDFPWVARAIPAEPDVRQPGWLTVLGASRDTAFPGECMALVKHLSTAFVQARFADVQGCIPVRRQALGHVAHSPHVSMETVTEALGRTTLTWPEDLRHEMQASLQMPGHSMLLAKGVISAEKALAEFERRLNDILAARRASSAWRRPQFGTASKDFTHVPRTPCRVLA